MSEGDWLPDDQSRALATDPECPADLLLHLSRHLPDEVLTNPALPLYLMENPDLLATLAPPTLVALAGHPRTPAPLLTALLATRGDLVALRLALVVHDATPIEMLRALASDATPKVRELARSRLGVAGGGRGP